MITLALIVCFIVVLMMMALMVLQLLAGSPPSESGFTRKFHLAQPWLNVVGNLFVLGVCFIALNRIIEYFGFFGPDLAAVIDRWLHYPFFALFALYAALWLHAFFLVKTRDAAP